MQNSSFPSVSSLQQALQAESFNIKDIGKSGTFVVAGYTYQITLANASEPVTRIRVRQSTGCLQSFFNAIKKCCNNRSLQLQDREVNQVVGPYLFSKKPTDHVRSRIQLNRLVQEEMYPIENSRKPGERTPGKSMFSPKNAFSPQTSFPPQETL